jgi:hypothetical protein
LKQTPYFYLKKNKAHKNFMKIKESVEKVLGPKALDHALFYSHEGSLRFDLAEGSFRIDRFLQAYTKADSILQELFQASHSLYICFAFYGNGSFLSHLSVFRSLKECQIKIPKKYETWKKHYAVSELNPVIEFDNIRTFIAFHLNENEISRYLWGAFAAELGIRPKNHMQRVYI